MKTTKSNLLAGIAALALLFGFGLLLAGCGNDKPDDTVLPATPIPCDCPPNTTHEPDSKGEYTCCNGDNCACAFKVTTRMAGVITPHAKGNAPHGRGNYPRAGGNTSRGGGNYPRAKGNTPQDRSNSPHAGGNYPRGEGNAPRAEGNTPRGGINGFRHKK